VLFVRTIDIKNISEAAVVFRKIGVDPYGIAAMAQKTVNANILLRRQPCKVANIIKQEMLSVGGDAAVARGSVSCALESSDVLIMGTQKQILALAKKIENQPFGLSKISADLVELLHNINKSKLILKTSRRKIRIGDKTLVMGILNVTPDSFSDGGLFYGQEKAIEHGLKMADEGADIIDIGGESTRPGSDAVPTSVELKRVIPVIEALAAKIKIPISIDTRKAKVAAQALAAGAEIINDISALGGDKNMAKTAADTGAGLILMHMRGTPKTMQKGDLIYDDLLGEIIDCLRKSIGKAMRAGVRKECLIVDPGIGFGKTSEDNYKIIRNLFTLKLLGLPVMLGTSRKAFIGNITGDRPGERLEGTAASVAAAVMNGCNIVRVHDVAAMKKVIAVADSIIRA
jgi:dihydropteroate synthase